MLRRIREARVVVTLWTSLASEFHEFHFMLKDFKAISLAWMEFLQCFDELENSLQHSTKHFKVHHRSNRVIFNSRGISNHVNSVSRNELLVELNIKFPENVSATTRLNANSYRCVKVIVSSSDALPATLFAIVCLTFFTVSRRLLKRCHWRLLSDDLFIARWSRELPLEGAHSRKCVITARPRRRFLIYNHGIDFVFFAASRYFYPHPKHR